MGCNQPHSLVDDSTGTQEIDMKMQRVITRDSEIELWKCHGANKVDEWNGTYN